MDKKAKIYLIRQIVIALAILIFSYYPLKSILGNINLGFDSQGALGQAIAEDLKTSMASVVGLLATLFLMIPFLRNKRVYAITIMLICIIIYGVPIGEGIMILTNTKHIFDPEIASSNWQSLDEYHRNIWIRFGPILYISIMGILYYRHYLKKQRKS